VLSLLFSRVESVPMMNANSEFAMFMIEIFWLSEIVTSEDEVNAMPFTHTENHRQRLVIERLALAGLVHVSVQLA
jgi:hypothetical protein